MSNYGKARTLPCAIAILRVIDATQIDELLETSRRVVAQLLHYRQIIRCADDDGDLAEIGIEALDPFAQHLLQGGHKVFEFGAHVGLC